MAAKKAAKKTASKKSPAKKSTTAKSASKKTTAKKAATKKDSSKSSAKASSAKTAKTAKKVTKKTTAKKAVSKKTATKTEKSKKASTKSVKKASTSKTTSSKAASLKKKKAEAVATDQPPKKIKFSINLAPENYKRNVAPGVMIEKAVPISVEEQKKAKKRFKKLTPAEVAKIREMLIDKRDDILREMRNQVGDSLNRSSTVKTDAADRASDVYDGDVSYEMAKMGHIELQEIDVALKKIDAGTYGECASCGDHISPSRLSAKPFASLCTVCRQEQERSKGAENGGSIWGFLDEESGDDSDEF